MKEGLKRVCGQCQSAEAADVTIPDTKPIEEYFSNWISDQDWEAAFNVSFPTFEEANPNIKTPAQIREVMEQKRAEIHRTIQAQEVW